MFKYIKKYFFFAIIAALFMFGEVSMDLIQPQIMSRIIDEGVLGVGGLKIIYRLGLLMTVLVIFGGLCGCLNNVFVNISGQNIGNEMRKDCFKKIMSVSFPELDKLTTGSLITRVTNDITQVQNFLSQFVRGMLRTFLLMFGSMYCVFRLNFTFGLIVLGAFPLILGCLYFCMMKADPLFMKLQAKLDRVNAIMQEDISGIRLIKACVREKYEKIRFGRANDELTDIQLTTLIIFAFMNPVINALMYVVIALILILGYSGKAATAGSIMAAVTYTTHLLHSILMTVMLFQNISRGIASWKRVKEILNIEPKIKDGNKNFPNISNNKCGEIEFRDVSFSYSNDNNQVILSNINLKINRGETVAIMGATGCGKTSLVNLIPRFYDVTGGAVFINGVDVREFSLKDLREKIAFVMQKSELFSTTIKENIAWGCPTASFEEICKAAVTAQADDFINSTPNKYDTVVAERGMSLSGGQKQRLSIARAVLKNAEIIILDDATSALDLKTEADFYDALHKLNPETTKIIIAQRIASVKNADRIIILENKKILAQGTHSELMETCKAYQEIYNSQMGE